MREKLVIWRGTNLRIASADSRRGFAVVSGEIRKLAEQSKLSTERIADLIERVQLETRSAVTAIDHGLGEVTALHRPGGLQFDPGEIHRRLVEWSRG